MGADHSLVGRRRLFRSPSLRRVCALLVVAAILVVLTFAAIVSTEGPGFLHSRHLGSVQGPWLWVCAVVAAVLCLGTFLHAMRGLRVGRPRFTQQEPGILSFDPWTRRASLNASLRWKNSNPELPLQLSSVEIVRYRLDGVSNDERIVGRMLTRPTILEPQAEGSTTMLFTLPVTHTPTVAFAEVVLRDELGRKLRTEVSFEAPRFFGQGPVKRTRWVGHG